MSTTTPDATLWLATGARRYFLVPSGVAIPPGPEQLTTVTGAGRAAADLAGLAPYEVQRAEAMEWLRGRWNQGVHDLLHGEHRAPPAAPPPVEPGPGLELLAALSDTDPRALADDPERLRVALGVVGERACALWTGAISDVPEELERARREAGLLTEELRSHGLPTGDLGAVVDAMRSLRSPAGAAPLRKASRWLEGLAARLQRAADEAESAGAPRGVTEREI